MQEQHNHQHHQKNGFEQRGNDCIDRPTNKHGRVVDNVVGDAFRKGFRQLVHSLPDTVGELNRISAGALKNGHGNRRLSVQPCFQCVSALSQFDPGNVRQTSDSTVLADFQHNIPKLIQGSQSPTDIQHQLKLIIRWRGLCAQSARSDL